MSNTDTWEARYKAGKDYTGTFKTYDNIDVSEVDVRVNCKCGKEFYFYQQDMSIECLGCKRIYKSTVIVEVGEDNNENPTT